MSASSMYAGSGPGCSASDVTPAIGLGEQLEVPQMFESLPPME